MFLVLYPEVTARILWKQRGMTGGLPKGFLHQSMGRKREALGRSLWCVYHPQMWQGHYILVMLLQIPFKMLLSDGKNHYYSVYVHFYMMEFWMIDLFGTVESYKFMGAIFHELLVFYRFLWITIKKTIIWWGCKFVDDRYPQKKNFQFNFITVLEGIIIWISLKSLNHLGT